MDERLEKALEFVNYKQTLNNQLHKLKIKAESELIFSEAGGKFTISRELICFIDYMVRNGYTESTLLDNNNNPVRISDTALFLKKITEKYFAVTNDYFRAAQLIKKSRSVESIIDATGG